MYSMIHHFLGDAFGILSCPGRFVVLLPCGARLPIHTLNYQNVLYVVPIFLLGVCLSVALLFVDLWQYCVCRIRSEACRIGSIC